MVGQLIKLQNQKHEPGKLPANTVPNPQRSVNAMSTSWESDNDEYISDEDFSDEVYWNQDDVMILEYLVNQGGMREKQEKPSQNVHEVASVPHQTAYSAAHGVQPLPHLLAQAAHTSCAPDA